MGAVPNSVDLEEGALEAGMGSGKRNRGWKFPNGRRKSKKAKKILYSGAILRVLCPGNYIGNVIGKGGSIISQIRQETGARIKVEDAMVGCVERVILFVGGDEKVETVKKEVKQEEGDETDGDEEEDEGDDAREYEESDEAKEDISSGDGKLGSKASSAQNALLKTFDRIIDGEERCEAVKQNVLKEFMGPPLRKCHQTVEQIFVLFRMMNTHNAYLPLTNGGYPSSVRGG